MPTAQALVPDRAVTPPRPPSARAGPCTSVHAVPFECSITAPWMAAPTAQALLTEVAATPLRIPSVGRAGLRTCRHGGPFQRSISGTLPVFVKVSPTAQALVAEVAVTPLSSDEIPGGVGLLTRAHAAPFQCRITVLPVKLVPPTAQASPGETAATA